jgi:hypothetical protein
VCGLADILQTYGTLQRERRSDVAQVKGRERRGGEGEEASRRLRFAQGCGVGGWVLSIRSDVQNAAAGAPERCGTGEGEGGGIGEGNDRCRREGVAYVKHWNKDFSSPSRSRASFLIASFPSLLSSQMRQLNRQLDPNLMDMLIGHARRLLPQMPRDGEGLYELEFVLAMLIELDVVSLKQVRGWGETRRGGHLSALLWGGEAAGAVLETAPPLAQ